MEWKKTFSKLHGSYVCVIACTFIKVPIISEWIFLNNLCHCISTCVSSCIPTVWIWQKKNCFWSHTIILSFQFLYFGIKANSKVNRFQTKLNKHINSQKSCFLWLPPILLQRQNTVECPFLRNMINIMPFHPQSLSSWLPTVEIELCKGSFHSESTYISHVFLKIFYSLFVGKFSMLVNFPFTNLWRHNMVVFIFWWYPDDFMDHHHNIMISWWLYGHFHAVLLASV